MRLYGFQAWAVDKLVDQRACLIGDDMGLGKTVEALALDLRRRVEQLAGMPQTQHKTLIVTPLTVRTSWEKHIRMMWPEARIVVVDPKNRQDLIDKLKEPYHYYIVHWEGVRLIDELRQVQWWHVIADEVHRAKNRKAQQTVALKKIRSEWRTGCSGTAADNNPDDLWSVLNWLYPSTWTSYWRFVNYFVKVRSHNKGLCNAFDPDTGVECMAYHKQGYREVLGVANAEELHEALRPYYVRRLKGEVLRELPPKVYSTITVELYPQQRRIYEQMKHDMLAWIGKHEEEPLAAPIVVAQLMRLQQFALAYADIKTVVRDGKEERRMTLKTPSAKLDALLEVLVDNPTRQFVVFSSSKQMANLVCDTLARCKITYVPYTGDTTPADRDANVVAFQAGKARVFVGTIQAGGEGITLTAASTVIFLDRVWNPSKNKQAEDRCHRIGQVGSVQVIDIVAKDTVDMGRLQKILLKWEWLRELLGDKSESGRNSASVRPNTGRPSPAG